MASLAERKIQNIIAELLRKANALLVMTETKLDHGVVFIIEL